MKVIPWINPVGGLGDTLMLSGVLKQVIERFPKRRFRLVRRTRYLSLLEGHPAIVGVGFPDKDAEILQTDYWSDPAYLSGTVRAMQILAKMFGLPDGLEERFFVPHEKTNDLLVDDVPWRRPTVVIAPGSASPRKEWQHARWERLVRMLRDRGCFILQLGGSGETYVPGAYSLLGLTSAKQVFPVLGRADAIITVDNFFMHAAHHVLKPATVLWGPTGAKVYGYPEQTHLLPKSVCSKPDGCIGSGKEQNYTSPCPMGKAHCVDQIRVEEVFSSAPVKNVLLKN